MKKALVLLSGGQDSTTCLYWALENFSYVEAVGFDYGQRHSLELKFAKKTALIANVNFEIISINNLFKNSALINKTQDLNAIHPNNNVEYINVGFEYIFRKMISLRGGQAFYGMNESKEGLTFGIGLIYQEPRLSLIHN